MSRQDELKQLITEHSLRLQKRKEQQALYGISADPSIPIEIEKIEAELVTLQAELAALPDILRHNPYRGLSAFREEDAAVFFGRESFTDQLVERVRQKQLVAMLGPSGSGKSSIVLAGLLPQLRREGNWLIVTFRPGSDPFRALAAGLLPCLEPAMTETDRLVEINKLARALSQADVPLTNVTARLLEKNSPVNRLLLVVDQFEELYTLCPDLETRQRFLDVLLQSVPPAPPPPRSRAPLHLVLTLRADFLSQALSYRPLADALGEADVKVGPMTEPELRRAVEKPAETQQAGFEAGLVERILTDVSRQPGNLPLLEFALTALWEQQYQGQLTHTAYEAIGGVTGALSQHADRVFEKLNESEQAQVHRILVQMVRPGEGTEDTRRLANKAELGETAWPLVQQLADQRLVVTAQAPDGQETVEVAHEALIRNWGRLHDWMESDRTFRAWQERLRFALRQWQTSRHDEGTLLRGAPLAEAEGWLAKRQVDLSRDEQAFIEASSLEQRRQKQRQTRLTWGTIATLVAVAVILAAMAIFAFNKSDEALTALATSDQRGTAIAQQAATAQAETARAETALSRQLVFASRLPTTNLAQALLLGREALYVSDTYEARDTLLKTLQTDAHLKKILSGWNVALSGDGKVLAYVNRQGISLWNVKTARLSGPPLTGHTGEIIRIALSANGHTLASASNDDTVIWWNLQTTPPVSQTFREHRGDVSGVALSGDGQILASASVDRSVIWRNLRTTPPLSQTLTGYTEPVQNVALSADGQTLASASGNQVTLWDMQPIPPISQTLAGHTEPVISVALSADGRMLASASADDTIILWDLQATPPLSQTLARHSNDVWSVAFSEDGQILVSASADKTIKLWNIQNTASLSQTLTGHSDIVWSTALSKDGQTLVSGSKDETIILWDQQAVEPLSSKVIVGNSHSVNDYVHSVAFSPDGKLLASGSGGQAIQLWGIANRKVIGEPLTGHNDYVYSVAFSPDGKLLASGNNDSTIQLWDVASRKASGEPLDGHYNYVHSVAFSPDGKLLASGSGDYTIRLWDVAQGKAVGEPLTGHSDHVASVAFSPDGTLLASGSTDETIQLWDVANRKAIGEPLLVGFRAFSTSSVAFSPDGKLLASGSGDKTIRLWDVASRKAIGEPLTGHSSNVYSVAFSPDGKLLASGDGDNTIRLWDIDPQSWVNRACVLANRNMTAAEWQQYFGSEPYRLTCPNLPPGDGAMVGQPVTEPKNE